MENYALCEDSTCEYVVRLMATFVRMTCNTVDVHILGSVRKWPLRASRVLVCESIKREDQALTHLRYVELLVSLIETDIYAPITFLIYYSDK